jgi:hypothetical protein
MRIFRMFEYSISKKDTIKDFFERTKSVLEDTGRGTVHCLFNLSDHPATFGSPNVEKVIKRFPELKKYEFTLSEVSEIFVYNYKVLSNLPKGLQYENINGATENLDFDTLYEIAKGIPRPFSFYEAQFVLNGIDWFRAGNVSTTPVISEKQPCLADSFSYAASSIAIRSCSGYNRRHNFIHAKVELEQPDANAEVLPELSKDIKETLMKLGKIKRETIIALPDEVEREMLNNMNYKGNLIINKYKEMIPNNIANILPHCDIPQRKDEAYSYSTIAIKKYIVDAFKKRGYAYKSNLSETGSYYTVKRTKSNNQIKLYFETGKLHDDLHCKFIYQGPLWIQEIDVQFTTFKGGIYYQISDEQLLQKLFDNIAAVVDYLENTLAKELDEIYGSAPRWYEYQK